MLHFDPISLLSLGGFTAVPRDDRDKDNSIELMARPDWTETKRRYLSDSTRYNPPGGAGDAH
jgi:hypothetical protein